MFLLQELYNVFERSLFVVWHDVNCALDLAKQNVASTNIAHLKCSLHHVVSEFIGEQFWEVNLGVSEVSKLKSHVTNHHWQANYFVKNPNKFLRLVAVLGLNVGYHFDTVFDELTAISLQSKYSRLALNLQKHLSLEGVSSIVKQRTQNKNTELIFTKLGEVLGNN